MTSKKRIVLPQIEDILKFTDAVIGTNKSENDANNKIRENIIATIGNVSSDYYINAIYGSHWSSFKQSLENSFRQICPSYYHYTIKHKAGRGNNYDYDITFLDKDNNTIKDAKLEFKYNASTIDEAPQFVSPMKPSQYLSASFEDYYYDNFLVHLLQPYGLSVPEKTTYLKTIHSDKPHCMSDAQKLYYQGSKQSSQYIGTEQAIAFYEMANKVSKDCIRQFIETADLDIIKLSQYLLESQKDKVYLLYKDGVFYIQTVPINDYIIESYVKQPIKFRYEATSRSQKKIHILLRWKNGNGIAFPAFQIS
jgi:hypothetical protein